MLDQLQKEFLVKLLKDKVEKLEKNIFNLDMYNLTTNFKDDQLVINDIKDLEYQVKITNNILEKFL
jgi:hypothetical protein